MFKAFFRRWRQRRMAAQLRHPKGRKGSITGDMMNLWNQHMYSFTLSQMEIRDNEKILEIGFGNGHFFPQIAAKAEGLMIYGLEQSSRMLHDAHESNKELIREGRLELREGLADSLPWPDNFFDRIFCINVIYFWDDPQMVLREIKRVLKNGGQFYATCRSKENMQQLPFTEWNFSLYSPAEWEKELEKAGFNQQHSISTQEPGLQQSNIPFQAEQYCVAAMKK